VVSFGLVVSCTVRLLAAMAVLHLAKITARNRSFAALDPRHP
jgi:hypothetical protein